VIDLISQFVRSFFNENNDVKKKSWISTLLPASVTIEKSE